MKHINSIVFFLALHDCMLKNNASSDISASSRMLFTLFYHIILSLLYWCKRNHTSSLCVYLGLLHKIHTHFSCSEQQQLSNLSVNRSLLSFIYIFHFKSTTYTKYIIHRQSFIIQTSFFIIVFLIFILINNLMTLKKLFKSHFMNHALVRFPITNTKMADQRNTHRHAMSAM